MKFSNWDRIVVSWQTSSNFSKFWVSNSFFTSGLKAASISYSFSQGNPLNHGWAYVTAKNSRDINAKMEPQKHKNHSSCCVKNCWVTISQPSMRCLKTVSIAEAQAADLDLSNPPCAKAMLNITEQFTYEILGLLWKLRLFRKFQMCSPVDNLSQNINPVNCCVHTRVGHHMHEQQCSYLQVYTLIW